MTERAGHYPEPWLYTGTADGPGWQNLQKLALLARGADWILPITPSISDSPCPSWGSRGDGDSVPAPLDVVRLHRALREVSSASVVLPGFISQSSSLWRELSKELGSSTLDASFSMIRRGKQSRVLDRREIPLGLLTGGTLLVEGCERRCPSARTLADAVSVAADDANTRANLYVSLNGDGAAPVGRHYDLAGVLCIQLSGEKDYRVAKVAESVFRSSARITGSDPVESLVQHRLTPGDAIVIHPGVVHEVLPAGPALTASLSIMYFVPNAVESLRMRLDALERTLGGGEWDELLSSPSPQGDRHRVAQLVERLPAAVFAQDTELLVKLSRVAARHSPFLDLDLYALSPTRRALSNATVRLSGRSPSALVNGTLLFVADQRMELSSPQSHLIAWLGERGGTGTLRGFSAAEPSFSMDEIVSATVPLILLSAIEVLSEHV